MPEPMGSVYEDFVDAMHRWFTEVEAVAQGDPKAVFGQDLEAATRDVMELGSMLLGLTGP